MNSFDKFVAVPLFLKVNALQKQANWIQTANILDGKNKNTLIGYSIIAKYVYMINMCMFVQGQMSSD